ncbi:reverse transcriptase domain-containing protein [Tanacetum coccineum]|uniref:Reverse transcriptase domain-containing protein n=1 Tax=Tanacetum coccineum TaxID=301880 RepID=A0ABQ4ZGD4_9ASTR
MADNRTMAQLLQAPTEGYEDAIVIPEINANFELKHGLINLVQNKQFFGHDKEDPHAHIRYFNKITSTMRFPDVPSTSIKLMLFPFSLEGSARIWLEKEPPHSILTWDDLVSKFINQFFPPSKTTNLRNEITRFQQRFDESFYEAWDRFNDLLRACPHHGFSELHQLDTFYNALNANDQDSLNSASVVAKVSSNSSTPGISPDVAALTTEVSELKNLMKTMLIDKQKAQAPATVKAVEQSCITCGGAYSYKNCPATDGNVYQDNIQEYVSQVAAANLIKEIPILDLRWFQIKSDLLVFLRFKTIKTVSIQIKEIISTKIEEPISIKTVEVTSIKDKFTNLQLINHQFIKLLLNKCKVFQRPILEINVMANDVVITEYANKQGLQNQMTNLTEMLSKFITSNTASSSNSGTLPSQTVINPREHVNAITTRSGKTCEGPSTPLVPTPVVSTPLKEPEQNPETSMDKVQKPSSENTAQVPPPEDHDSIFIEIPKPKAKKIVQEPNSLEPNSYQPKLSISERNKSEREKIHPVLQQSSKNKQFAHTISVIDFLKNEPFSGSTTNHSDALPPSSSPVKTSEILKEFADELTLSKKDVHEENFQVYSNPLFEFDDNFTSSNENPLFNEIDEDVENENSNVLDSDEPVLLNTPLSDKVESFDPENDIDEIDAFQAMENLLSDDTTHNLAPEVISDYESIHNTSVTFSPRSDPLHHEFAGELITLPSRITREHEDYLSRMTMLCEISTSRSQENVHANPSSIIESLPTSLIPVEDNDPNDDSEDEDNELPNLDHQDNPSSPRPPPEPPDVCLNFKPATAMRNEDFNQGEIVLSLNVEDVNSFTFVIWTFLPFFTYPEDSPVILSLRSEDLVFDPGISTFHFSLKPVPFALPKDE